jgi:hypothetical protein
LSSLRKTIGPRLAGVLSATTAGSTVNLAWPAATDVVGTALYTVTRVPAFAAPVTTTATAYADTTASGNPVYSVTVTDSRGLTSHPALTAGVTLAPSSEVPAFDTRTPTKYVASSGNYLGNAAFTTLQAAFDVAVPGDVIAIAPGTYNQRAALTRSGTAAQPIYVRCADYNNRPLFDGQYSTDITPGWGPPFGPGQWCMIGVQAEYVTIDGINIRNVAGAGIGVGLITNNGSFISASERNTFFRDTRFIRCDVRGTNGSSWRTTNVDGCEFLGCTALDSERSQFPLGTGRDFTWGSACWLMGRRVTMIECLIGQCSGEGIHAGAHTQWGNENPSGTVHIQVFKLILRNNRVFNTWSAPIYITNVDADSSDPSIVERNVVWHTNDTSYWYNGSGGYPQYGIDVGSESPRGGPTWAYGTNNFAGARNLIIRNNIVTGALLPFRLGTEPGQDTVNVRVLNNTFYQTNPGSAASVASVVHSPANGQSNIVFKNNLVADTSPERGCRIWDTPGGTWERGNNLFPQTPPAALVAGSNVITASPGLTNPTYNPGGLYPSVVPFDTNAIRLQSGSPAIGAGEVRADVTTDFFGSPRPANRNDIGAHQAA